MPKTSKQPTSPPFIDRRMLVRGTSFLRKLSRQGIQDEIPHGSAILIQDGDDRLAVMLRFEDYEKLAGRN